MSMQDDDGGKSQTQSNPFLANNIKQEWKWSNERYEQVAQIGVGAYGVVFKARDLQNDDGYVAMKCVRVENTEQGMPLSMVREIALLRQLETKEHPNVVKLLDICLGRRTCQETQLMLVFEHIDQDLDMYLRSLPVDHLKEETIAEIMRQILLGIDFLHSMRVVHRDLKPQNILIAKSGMVKIADFGLARLFSVDMALTAVVVTLWYRAPEVLLQGSYATPVDLWSVGCIFAELYNRRPLFRGSGDVNQLRKIFDLIGRPSESEWPADVAIPISSFPVQSPKPVTRFVPGMDPVAADLFLKFLTFNPSSRPNPNQAMEHNFFKKNCQVSNVDLSNSSSSASNHRRLPYALNLKSAKQALPAGENYSTPIVDSLDENSIEISSSSSRLSVVTSVVKPANTERSCLSTNCKRAFGNPLPLNVKDGASGHLQLVESTQETAFLTPPSDLASSGDDDESSPTRSSSSSETTSVSNSNFPLQQSSVTPVDSVDHLEADHNVVRRKRFESEGHSRMSWTSDPSEKSSEVLHADTAILKSTCENNEADKS